MRQIVADFLPPRKFNQLFWFTGVEVAGYPFGLLAFNAELIQLIASPLKNKQPMPELLEIAFAHTVLRRDRLGDRRDPGIDGQAQLLGDELAQVGHGEEFRPPA